MLCCGGTAAAVLLRTARESVLKIVNTISSPRSLTFTAEHTMSESIALGIGGVKRTASSSLFGCSANAGVTASRDSPSTSVRAGAAILMLALRELGQSWCVHEDGAEP